MNFRPILLLLILLATGCADRKKLTMLYYVDANGFAQTVTQPLRLERYEKVDFLAEQPYQKVMRTWKDIDGQNISILTSYYPSGQIMQYLEGRSGKAWGAYREWFENGQMRINSQVSSGKLDFGELAEKSWVFEEKSYAYSKEGTIEAEISYTQGIKEGQALLYHPNGNLWQQIPYHNGLIDGEFFSWYNDKEIFVTANYSKGLLDGPSLRFWPENEEATRELYQKGKLLEGKYFSIDGTLIAQVTKGHGQRIVFGKTTPIERQTIEQGEIKGWVGFYDDRGQLWHETHILNGLKEGWETYFYFASDLEAPLQPKISIQWQAGLMNGVVRTWFESGQLQSERQVSQDKLHGTYLAYYPDGEGRIVEEYTSGQLMSGDYFEKGATKPVSSIRDGQGKASLFNDSGQLERLIIYRDGEPTLNQSSESVVDTSSNSILQKVSSAVFDTAK